MIFFAAGKFDIDTIQKLNVAKKVELDSYIKTYTRFKSFIDFIEAALVEYAETKDTSVAKK